MRRYPFAYVPNLRDLGGYPAADNTSTQYGRFLRSSAPLKLLVKEFALLQRLHVITVIDLRSAEEAQREMSAFAENAAFTCHNIPMPGAGILPTSKEEVCYTYCKMAADFACMRQIYSTMLNADGGVLFHCVAGKDRTGVVAALLLALSGVPLPDILADYQVTETYIAPLVRVWQRENPAFPDMAARSDPACLAQFFAHFDETYGTPYCYFSRIGISKKQQRALVQKLCGAVVGA